jgi:hypothetical protein
MDNGLIFPYPLTRANAEPGDANLLSRLLCPSGCGGLVRLGSRLVVGE